MLRRALLLTSLALLGLAGVASAKLVADPTDTTPIAGGPTAVTTTGPDTTTIRPSRRRRQRRPRLRRRPTKADDDTRGDDHHRDDDRAEARRELVGNHARDQRPRLGPRDRHGAMGCRRVRTARLGLPPDPGALLPGDDRCSRAFSDRPRAAARRRPPGHAHLRLSVEGRRQVGNDGDAAGRPAEGWGRPRRRRSDSRLAADVLAGRDSASGGRRLPITGTCSSSRTGRSSRS